MLEHAELRRASTLADAFARSLSPPHTHSAGKFVGVAMQTIDLSTRSYDNELTLFGGVVAVVLRATWEVDSDSQWTVLFENVRVSLLGRQVLLKRFEGRNAREWLMTRVCDDYRIVRARVAAGAALGQTPFTVGGAAGETPAGKYVTFYMERTRRG